ncbi:DinB/UmuC family translesion DNA polymerase [Microbulbifer sp. JMSA008]|uniref:DinB/UmuC family translesion DNA polymerase n=1 Tax=Microbulbifer sp. JMSA008 TaxID=3243373 RepID=UPI00403970A4
MDIDFYMGLGLSPSAALLFNKLPEHRQWLQQTHSPPTPQQWREWINNSPCKLLACDNKTIEELYSHGFRRVSQLLALPLSELEAYFGSVFINYLARINGSQQAPVTYHSQSTYFDKKLLFSRPLSNGEQLLHPCSLLLRELCQRLQRHGLPPQKLHWQLQNNKIPTTHFNIEISFSKPEEQELIAQTKLRLKKISFNKPIHSLSLSCTKLNPQSPERLNDDLLESRVLNTNSISQNLIDKLQERLGSQALSGVNLKGNL